MDPIADMLVIIKNGYLAQKARVQVSLSKMKLAIAKILQEEKFVKNVKVDKSNIVLDLLYHGQKPAIGDIKRVSKLGRRLYIKSKHLKPIKGGRGMIVVSTPQGLMTQKDAKAKNLGGEAICQVW